MGTGTVREHSHQIQPHNAYISQNKMQVLRIHSLRKLATRSAAANQGNQVDELMRCKDLILGCAVFDVRYQRTVYVVYMEYNGNSRVPLKSRNAKTKDATIVVSVTDSPEDVRKFVHDRQQRHRLCDLYAFEEFNISNPDRITIPWRGDDGAYSIKSKNKRQRTEENDHPVDIYRTVAAYFQEKHNGIGTRSAMMRYVLNALINACKDRSRLSLSNTMRTKLDYPCYNLDMILEQFGEYFPDFHLSDEHNSIKAKGRFLESFVAMFLTFVFDSHTNTE